MKPKSFSKNNLAFKIISAATLLILIYSIIAGTIGFSSFTDNMRRQNGEKAVEIGRTVQTYINSNHIEQYLKNGGNDEEWKHSAEQIQSLCNTMYATMIYVICADAADYGQYTTVFHTVSDMDDAYTPLSVGEQVKTEGEIFSRNLNEIYAGDVDTAFVIGKDTLQGEKKPNITALIPDRDEDGKVNYVICVQLPLTDTENRNEYLVKVAVSAIILIVLIVIFYARYMRKHFVTPLRRVSEETTRFAKENTKGNTLGELSTVTEISSIAHAVDEMETEMLEYIDNLTAVTAEKERIGTELSIAKKIQKSAVPNVFPAFPDHKEFDIYASMTPAKEVGGDFYNFFLVDDDHLALVIADVSGKGVPAALFMMVTNILIADRIRIGGTPAEVLEYVNNVVCARNDAGMFVTVWLGVLELSTGKVIACNAGHDDPALYHKGEDFELFKTNHDIAIGVMEEFPYHNYELQMNKGDKLFLYTDGVPEATDKDEKMFTLNGMVDALNRYKEKTPEDILQGVNASVGAFVGDAPQFDDLTMLCVELKDLTESDRFAI
ncbi:MAG: PP2C family protein-serine/threonine phosphatase [Eubacterium sp.]|nr:PP2C family protein-serine/threonine phosphatase [Eubacterium sp.]